MSHRSLVMVKRTYLHIAIISLVSAVVWLIVTIYQALMTQGAVAVDQDIVSPITPKLEEAALAIIVDREDVAAIPFAPTTSAVESAKINEVTTQELLVAPEEAPISTISGSQL